MPTGYKLVISRALGMHSIYCPQPSGTRPSGFGAINAIHPSCPYYNYSLYAHILRPSLSTIPAAFCSCMHTHGIITLILCRQVVDKQKILNENLMACIQRIPYKLYATMAAWTMQSGDTLESMLLIYRCFPEGGDSIL